MSFLDEARRQDSGGRHLRSAFADVNSGRFHRMLRDLDELCHVVVGWTFHVVCEARSLNCRCFVLEIFMIAKVARVRTRGSRRMMRRRVIRSALCTYWA